MIVGCNLLSRVSLSCRQGKQFWPQHAAADAALAALTNPLRFNSFTLAPPAWMFFHRIQRYTGGVGFGATALAELAWLAANGLALLALAAHGFNLFNRSKGIGNFARGLAHVDGDEANLAGGGFGLLRQRIHT